SRRMQEMSKMFGGMDMSMFPKDETLIINTTNSLIKKLYSLHGSEDKKEDIELICQHVYDMALMSQRQLEADAMTRFLERSNKILEKLTQN
ncbi:MAG TPA: molecular chaperone HtpG, partial [Clostridia bacterium]